MGIMGLASPGMGTVAQIVNLCGHRPVVDQKLLYCHS